MGEPALDSSPAPTRHRLNLRVLCFRNDPGTGEPVMLARELIAEGRYEEAVDLTGRSLETEPEDADLLLTHGVALRARGELKTAQLALTRAAKADPEWPEAWHHLAAVLVARGRIAQAYRVAERGLELDPFDEELRAIFELGELEERAQRYIDGDRDAEDPTLLAQALLARGRVETAFELTRAALMEEIDDEDLMVAHATAARARGDLDEAVSVLTLATMEAPDFAEAWRLLALSLEERGEPDRAREAAAHALAAAPFEPALRALHARLDAGGETLVVL
ncbi:MAG: tetratricopeptide repeat protein [Sandaracinaceae bacterium]|nr:tetratricopeptide repeat protein [Sandaracinaceae bacterium]